MALVPQTMDSTFHQLDINYGQVNQLAIGASLDSEAFFAGGHSWKIKLYPRGSDNGFYLSIYLEPVKRSAAKSVNAFFEAFVMDKNDQPSPAAARSGVCQLQKHNLGWPRFISVAELEANYLSEGFVTILFAVVVVSDNIIHVSPPEVGKQIGTLLDTKDGSDISFIVNGETFHAHRALLAARSPVFREELYASVCEGTTSSITLDGMAPEVFRVMLAFIYTDYLIEDHDSLPATLFHGLLAAADHYALERLKLLCAQKLLDDLTLDTFVTTLGSAAMYNCPELKDKCLDFFVANANYKFAATEGFLQLTRNFVHIFDELRQGRRPCSNFYHPQLPHNLRPSDMALVCRTMESEFHQFDVEYDQAKKVAVGTAMDSIAFSVGGHSWRVNLYPCGRDISDNGAFMSIYLEHLNKSANTSVNAFFEVILIDKNGQPLRGARSGVTLFHKQEREWGWVRFISLTDLENYHITQGRFKFICAITVLSDNSIRVPPSDIGKQIGVLLESTKGTNVSFVVAGETFRAHRAVLSAHSPVFRAALLGTMAEATMASITILDTAPAIFRIMLRFIYTGAFPGDDEFADPPFKMLSRLLAASDLYALDRLKLWYASKLWDGVAVNSVLPILLVADMHSCMELKERCLDFILRKGVAWYIYLTDNYVQFVQKFPHLVAELQDRHKHLVAACRANVIPFQT